jgi:hypothetical protein
MVSTFIIEHFADACSSASMELTNDFRKWQATTMIPSSGSLGSYYYVVIQIHIKGMLNDERSMFMLPSLSFDRAWLV